MSAERGVTVMSGGLALEGRLREGSAALSLLMLHPHPQYGGDLHNPVVVGVCDAAAALTVTTLRVNFRGAGGSQGSFDNGIGEQDDALAALAFLREAAPAAPIVLAGYSFGAMIASRIVDRAAASAMLLVSPAGGSMPDVPAVQSLTLVGSEDAYVDAAGLASRAGPLHRVVVAPGIDHFWWGGGETIARESSAFLSAMIGAP